MHELSVGDTETFSFFEKCVFQKRFLFVAASYIIGEEKRRIGFQCGVDFPIQRKFRFGKEVMKALKRDDRVPSVFRKIIAKIVCTNGFESSIRMLFGKLIQHGFTKINARRAKVRKELENFVKLQTRPAAQVENIFAGSGNRDANFR